MHPTNLQTPCSAGKCIPNDFLCSFFPKRKQSFLFALNRSKLSELQKLGFIVTKNVTLLNDQSKKPEVLNLCYIVSVNMAFIIFWTWFCNKSWNRLFLLYRSINIVNCVTILLFTAHWINLIALVCCVCSMYISHSYPVAVRCYFCLLILLLRLVKKGI